MFRISARDGIGSSTLKKAFTDHVNALRNGPGDIVVTNARHVDALTKARAALQDAQKAIEIGISGELLAIDLRRAQHHLGEITGPHHDGRSAGEHLRAVLHREVSRAILPVLSMGLKR